MLRQRNEMYPTLISLECRFTSQWPQHVRKKMFKNIDGYEAIGVWI